MLENAGHSKKHQNLHSSANCLQTKLSPCNQRKIHDFWSKKWRSAGRDPAKITGWSDYKAWGDIHCPSLTCGQITVSQHQAPDGSSPRSMLEVTVNGATVQPNITFSALKAPTEVQVSYNKSSNVYSGASHLPTGSWQVAYHSEGAECSAKGSPVSLVPVKCSDGYSPDLTGHCVESSRPVCAQVQIQTRVRTCSRRPENGATALQAVGRANKGTLPVGGTLSISCDRSLPPDKREEYELMLVDKQAEKVSLASDVLKPQKPGSYSLQITNKKGGETCTVMQELNVTCRSDQQQTSTGGCSKQCSKSTGNVITEEG